MGYSTMAAFAIEWEAHTSSYFLGNWAILYVDPDIAVLGEVERGHARQFMNGFGGLRQRRDKRPARGHGSISYYAY